MSSGGVRDVPDHGMTTMERLVYMANQIARNFEAIGHDAAAAATADHIASFWDPRMKERIFAWRAGSKEGLSPGAATAIDRLMEKGAPAPQTRATKFNGVDEVGRGDAG